MIELTKAHKKAIDQAKQDSLVNEYISFLEEERRQLYRERQSNQERILIRNVTLGIFLGSMFACLVVNLTSVYLVLIKNKSAHLFHIAIIVSLLVWVGLFVCFLAWSETYIKK
jgi:hypothetical protein